MTRVVVPAEKIATANIGDLTVILKLLLHCTNDLASTLAQQCHAAIADLPEDSRPTTYDSLVDVARFCVEEEPGWDKEASENLVSSYPRLCTLFGESERLTSLCSQYESHFLGLHFITSDEVREPALAADELENYLRRWKPSDVFKKDTPEWQAELERLLEAFWDVAVDRASNLEPGPIDSTENDTHELNEQDGTGVEHTVRTGTEPKVEEDSVTPNKQAPLQPAQSSDVNGVDMTSLDISDNKKASSSSSTRLTDAAINKEEDVLGTDDEPLLSLASFRALAVAAPVLERFFEHDLVASIRLDEVVRSLTGGAYAWHAAPVAPRNSVTDTKSGAAAHGTVSLASTILHTPSLDADTPASYSRDITTGTRGKVVGFLGGLLGEEGKTRMDALADQVGLRLQTHSVKGPLPSFAESAVPVEETRNTWRSALLRGASAAAGAVTEKKPSTFGGRLAGAFGSWRRDNGSDDAKEQTITADPVPEEDHMMPEVRKTMKGSDLAMEGPEAAVESLRAANEALAQERDTFIIDEVQSTGDISGDIDDDGASDVEDLETLEQVDRDKNSGLQGVEARQAQGTYFF